MLGKQDSWYSWWLLSPETHTLSQKVGLWVVIYHADGPKDSNSLLLEFCQAIKDLVMVFETLDGPGRTVKMVPCHNAFAINNFHIIYLSLQITRWFAINWTVTWDSRFLLQGHISSSILNSSLSVLRGNCSDRWDRIEHGDSFATIMILWDVGNKNTPFKNFFYCFKQPCLGKSTKRTR